MKHRTIPFSPPDIGEREKQAVNEALSSGWITTGPRTKQFEKAISDYVGTNSPGAALFPSGERADRQGAGKGAGADPQSRSKGACQSAGSFAKAGGQGRRHQTDQGEGQRVRSRQTATGQGRDCQTGCGTQGGAVYHEAQHGAVIAITLTEEILVAATEIPSVMFFETGLSCY